MDTSEQVQENLRRLALVFPECVTESKLQDGTVKLALNTDMFKLDFGLPCNPASLNEPYLLLWSDKEVTRKSCYPASTYALRPILGESRDFIKTHNVFIKGDNFEVMRLLRNPYFRKIKMIHYKPRSSEELLSEQPDITYTAWQNSVYKLMNICWYPLTEDGVIFISTNDRDLADIKKMADEVFGKEDFIATFCCKRSIGNATDGYPAYTNDLVLCYARSIQYFKPAEMVYTQDSYPYFDESTQRFYKKVLLRKWGSNSRREDRPSLYYPIKAPDGADVYPTIYQENPDGSINQICGCWRHKPSSLQKMLQQNRVEFKQTEYGWIPYEKIFALSEDQQATKKFDTWIEDDSSKADRFEKLFGERMFENEQSVVLLKQLFKMVDLQDNDIVLDISTHSDTTADAIMQLNIEDGIQRRFMIVQDYIDLTRMNGLENPEIYNRFSTLNTLGMEYIRRAGDDIKADAEGLNNFSKSSSDDESALIAEKSSSPSLKKDAHEVDIGFRVFNLDSSNMLDVYLNLSEISQEHLYAENIKDDRSSEDLLIQTMLKMGIKLSDDIQIFEIDGKKVFSVRNNYLLACFEPCLSNEFFCAAAKLKPDYFVIRDSSLGFDYIGDNMSQFFHAYSPSTAIRII